MFSKVHCNFTSNFTSIFTSIFTAKLNRFHEQLHKPLHAQLHFKFLGPSSFFLCPETPKVALDLTPSQADVALFGWGDSMFGRAHHLLFHLMRFVQCQ